MKQKLTILILVVTLALFGCKDKEKEEEEVIAELEVIDEIQEEIVEEEQFSFYYPLTGIGTNEQIDRRAIAVMINNHTSARPHSNLHQADVIYEVLAEGDITRFLAIYHSEQPDKIGPVRSARDYYIELAKGYNSIYVAHGYSPDAYSMITNKYIDSINGMQYDGTLFYRSNDRKAPHNSYTSYENILTGASKNKYDLTTNPPALSFMKQEEAGNISGNMAKKVVINFFQGSSYNSEYIFDAELKKYKRYSKNTQTVDSDTKVEVLIDNLFIVETKHEVIDSEGRRKIDLSSGGKAYLIQNGVMNEVSWKSVNGQIVPVINGQLANLIPGKTWITFVPTSPDISTTVTIVND